MRVVVVGASGNLGTAFLRRMAASGEHELVGVSRRVPTRTGPYATVGAWHSIDVGDPDAVTSLTDAFRGADTVVNFAWAFQPTRRPEVLYRTGVQGSAQVVRAASAARVRHLVHTSSVGAYGPRRDLVPVNESFPVTGVPGSVYSGHKTAAEADLDRWEHEHPGSLVVTRIRPGFVLQRDAGAALFRYGLPGWLPGFALSLLPALPLDRTFVIPVIHSDDVADAVARLVDHPVPGALNLASARFVNRGDVAQVLGALPVNVPPTVLETVVAATWRAQLQPLDAGWIRLAYAVPLLDSSRAQRELGWRAEHDPVEALAEAVDGMRHGTGAGGPVLRPRSWRDGLRRLVHSGPISRRQQP
jgi:UDP-glucose 4-epimerase